MPQDLLNSLGSNDNNAKVADGTSTPDQATHQQSQNVGIGPESDDILAKTKSNESDGSVGKEAKEPQKAESQESSKKEEPSKKDESSVKDPSDWTKDSAFKEIKKLRDENKTQRLKYEELLKQIKDENESRVRQKEEEAKQYAEAKKELDKLKEQDADKKRNLEEKLAHREAKLQELESMVHSREKEFQEKLTAMETQLQEYKAQEEAQNKVYQERLEEQMQKIPDKFRNYADLIVKGAGDPRDALLALNEAISNGVFEEKQVVVNHSVPGANNGARATEDSLKEAQKQQKQSMNSKQKIAAALQEMRGGDKNSAFPNFKT